MILRPQVLCIGLGCNRDTPFEIILSFLKETLKTAGLAFNCIVRLGTVDIKQDEAGLIELGRSLNLSFDFFTRETLNSVAQIQTPSKMVEKHVGTKSVCEAAAILSAGKFRAQNPKAGQSVKLILPKQKNKDVTVAVTIVI